jgi:hypothetical protein
MYDDLSGMDASGQRPVDPDQPAEPYSAAELGEALRLPHRAIDLVLTQRERWIASLAQGRQAPRLLAVLLVTSLLYSLPYGLLLDPRRCWQIAALYLGSVAICFPSLHVFSSFLGVRLRVEQSLALALLTATVASIFSLGFAPVFWFLSLTMPDRHSTASLQGITCLLLTVSLLAGLLQLGRCSRGASRMLGGKAFPRLVILWQGLLVFITYRMGEYLGILA